MYYINKQIMKSVSLLHELKYGQNLNEFSIEDASHCTREKQLLPT